MPIGVEVTVFVFEILVAGRVLVLHFSRAIERAGGRAGIVLRRVAVIAVIGGGRRLMGGELVFIGHEAGGRKNKGGINRVFDYRGAGVFGALAWDGADAGGGTFERGFGETGEEFLGCHVRKVGVGGNSVAGEAGGETARIKARPAGEYESEQFACGVAEKVEILCEMASFGDALKEALALIANVVTGFNVDIACVEGEEQHADQGDVVEGVFAKGFGERIGAKVADDRHAFLGNVGPGFG